ncbi:unnamed protein product [Danaus chrysippus]|uniref:(African queen) hypothetical protein n=1 Tax=Danaus chrysippus TaxID=151541 RepID=A0A8J2W359_9NEOP|nr:unnamed protein product [Danaus chrysippus]
MEPGRMNPQVATTVSTQHRPHLGSNYLQTTVKNKHSQQSVRRVGDQPGADRRHLNIIIIYVVDCNNVVSGYRRSRGNIYSGTRRRFRGVMRETGTDNVDRGRLHEDVTHKHFS